MLRTSWERHGYYESVYGKDDSYMMLYMMFIFRTSLERHIYITTPVDWYKETNEDDKSVYYNFLIYELMTLADEPIDSMVLSKLTMLPK